MKTLRNVKLGAIAVIANGMVALLIASPAQALSCGTSYHCTGSSFNCPNEIVMDGICEFYTPSGCSFVQATCVVPYAGCGNQAALRCDYA